jgi:hypothetical protein
MKTAVAMACNLSEVQLEITPDGRILGLWNDALNLAQLGHCVVRRASYVEFDARRQCWCVREARPSTRLARMLQRLLGRPLGCLLHAAPTREQALRWEAQYFSPGGPGWKRLNGRRRP